MLPSDAHARLAAYNHHLRLALCPIDTLVSRRKWESRQFTRFFVAGNCIFL